jgi:hypothetical protein
MESKAHEMGAVAGITIKWAQMCSPKGETRTGFWVLDNGVPVHDRAVFETKKEAEEWIRSFNWF